MLTEWIMVVGGKRIGGRRYIGDHGITLFHMGASQMDEERFTAQSGKFNRFCIPPWIIQADFVLVQAVQEKPAPIAPGGRCRWR
jgi:hypothetical protein